MTYFGECEFCHKVVQSPSRPAYPVEGWTLDRGATGGANQLIGRKRLPNRVAHEQCAKEAARKQRAGEARPGQEVLV